MFRGNILRNGISSSSMAGKPSLAWLLELGEIVASPVVSSDVIYVGTFDGMMCALDMNGNVRWEVAAGAPVLSSPAVFDDRAFFASSDHRLYCLNVETGERIWEFEAGDKFWSSPAIAANTLFIGSLDGHIYSVDVRSGRMMWKFPTMNMIDSSPCIANETLFMGSRDGILYAFNSTVPAYIG
jgi:glucose dehydrogenase